MIDTHDGTMASLAADGALAECDMVMKGGVTSGVVYPGTIVTLAKKYRFRGLGGTSAGAIAAAMTAAAELGRSKDIDSFSRLAEMPKDLGENMLHRLHPSKKLQPLWTFILREMDRSSLHREKSAFDRLGRVGRMLSFVTAVQPGPFAVTVVTGGAITALLGLTAGGWAWSTGALIGIILVTIGLGLSTRATMRATLSALDDNNFGFCDGHTVAKGMEDTAPVTDWIDDELRILAGLSDDQVLTYGDLWGSTASTAYLREAHKDQAKDRQFDASDVLDRDINLTMMVTNLGQTRAHAFPFDSQAYFFCEDCLGQYFGPKVMAHLREHGPERKDDRCPKHPQRALRDLPFAPDMPVVIGVRMSFSLPVLFSAVPLHVRDWTRREEQDQLTIAWFADGGATSNFPIHFFDSQIPSRPTFGISLDNVHPDRLEDDTSPMVDRGKTRHVREIDSFGASLKALLKAMQNWQDESLRSHAGYKDRIVTVRLGKKEGGLNLTMPPTTIEALSERGADAAREFDEFDIDDHRWTRFRVALHQVGAILGDWNTKWHSEDVVGTPIQGILDDRRAAKDGSRVELVKVRLVSSALADWGSRFESEGKPGSRRVPRPTPVLRPTSRQ